MSEDEGLHQVKIIHKGVGDAEIWVGDRDLAKLVKGYAVFVEDPSDRPTVVIDFSAGRFLEYSGEAVVTIKEEMATALELLGWTRPDLPDATEDRPDDGMDE